VLYQAYFTAFLVLAGLKFPVNPGNPYIGSKTQNGFGTFGGPDYAAAQGEVAARALNRVWFQKWLIHLTHRPEAGGGVLHQILSGNQSKVDARLDSNVLNSQAVARSFSKYGTYLLSQAFPEGSPYHPSYPSYPTGHGTVWGACITMLKFFFDGSQVWPNPVVPSSDGLSLAPYTGSDGGQITVNGELSSMLSEAQIKACPEVSIHSVQFSAARGAPSQRDSVEANGSRHPCRPANEPETIRSCADSFGRTRQALVDSNLTPPSSRRD